MTAYRPTFDEFCQLAAQAKCVPIYRQLVSDTLTPVSAYARIASNGNSFLFESVVGGEKIGRYSFLGSQPSLTIEAYGQRVIQTDAAGQQREQESADPLAVLEQLLAERRSVHLPGLPRFCGGAVGYAGYDTVRYVEHLPNAPTDDRQLPDLSFSFFDRMVLFDQIKKTILVVAHVTIPTSDPSASSGSGSAASAATTAALREAYARGCAQVDELCQQLQQPSDGLQLTDIDLSQQPVQTAESNTTREGYETAVRRSQEYIRAGDIFQVVLSQRFAIPTKARALDIYRSLRVVDPSPFMFLLTTAASTLIGSSPEIMVRVEEGEVTIRPLAGTRRRGATLEEDRRLAEELLADPKERAEHVMLVDLARNDLGRVCEYGTVRISDVMVVERYSHVMHITSNAYGQLSPGKSALDALRSGLPAGTVSGAPKVRAMQIIDELEPHRRGPYGGAVGYIDYTGNMDTCIALRTLVLKGQTAYIQAGAGIVADSVPSEEYQETVNKAKVLFQAVQIAEKQLTGRS